MDCAPIVDAALTKLDALNQNYLLRMRNQRSLDGSWLVARGSWLVARGSWLVARGS